MPRISEQSLIENRARILAMVQFTSRPDLQASDFPEDGGIDLLVRIISDGPGYQKLFGVKLFGATSPFPDSDRANRFLRTANWVNKKEGKSSSKFALPVIILVFSMVDDKGYFAWSIEPIVDRTGGPKLKVHESLTCAPFNRSTLATIVKRVNEWHDSLVALLETA
jgi:hypothetical protein